MAKLKIYLERRNQNGSYLDAKLELPASKYEIEDAFQRIQSDGGVDYSIEVEDYKLDFDLPENCRLDELNYFAARIERMDEFGRDYLQSQIYFDETPPDMKRLINMTFNNDYLEAIYAGDFETVGQNYIDGKYNDSATLSDEIYDLIDFKKAGQHIAKIEGGKLLKNGWYVFPTGKAFEEVYDGVKLPEIMGITDEDDYVFKLLIAEAPVNDSEETIDNAVWITLPGDMDEFNRLANTQNEGCIQDCVYYEMKSAIPQITSEVFGDMYDFETLHEIDFHPKNQIKTT